MGVRTPLCDRLGIEHPVAGFTPSEHVAAAISRAGGLGVLGCVRFNDPAELDQALDWMDAHTDGKPYGVDVVMPATVPAEGAAVDLASLVPQGHRDFVDATLAQLGVPPLPGEAGAASDGVLGWLHSVARKHVEVALTHRPALIANALGPPPADVIAAAHQAGAVVAALAGKASHARAHVADGVDIVVAQGHEAGGHTGEIATMVLVPEVADAVGDSAMVLAAGGIGNGRQLAAALALGASGAWTGSAWLLTAEYAQLSAGGVQQALLAATSSDTVRSRIYSGKPARLLRNRWTAAWEQPGAPAPLPMPLQNILVARAHQALMRSGDPSVVPMPAGQVIGAISQVRPVAQVMASLMQEAQHTLDRLQGLQ